MAEGVGSDLEAQHPVAEVGPRRRPHAPHERRLGPVLQLGATAERREVVLADEGIAAQPQRGQVERLLDEPGAVGHERVGHRPVEDRVAVGAGHRREAGVEGVGHDRRRSDGDVGLEHLVERTLEGGRVGARRRRVEADDVAPRVHALVGAARDRELDGVAQHAPDGVGQRAADRADADVGGEPVERRAVVRDEQRHPHRGAGVGWRVVEVEQRRALEAGSAHAAAPGRTYTSSMRAVGALSPGRVPSLRIRV